MNRKHPKRWLGVLAVTSAVLLACGSTGSKPAAADNACGTPTAPCGVAGLTVPAGWSVAQVQVDGRTVQCIVFASWKSSGDARASVTMSCDWQAK